MADTVNNETMIGTSGNDLFHAEVGTIRTLTIFQAIFYNFKVSGSICSYILHSITISG